MTAKAKAQPAQDTISKAEEIADQVMGYDADLPFTATLTELAKIEQLVGITETFRANVRAVALRVISHQDKFRCFFGVCQPSQLGTGFGGGRQSDRDDHVRLDFITMSCGDAICIFMVGDKLKFSSRQSFGDSAVFEASYSSQDELRGVVDFYCTQKWVGNI